MINEEATAKAAKCLANMAEDPLMFTAGRRNNDAVNLCIVCNILFADPFEVAMMITKDADDYKHALDHIERVKPYVEDWATHSYGFDFALDAEYMV